MGGTAEHLHLFAKGSQVEVGSNEEGFKGSWYVATVLEPPSTSDSKKKSHSYSNVYVQYNSLLADEDGSKPLRERVNVAFVRPAAPPQTQIGQSFVLNDVVDAFYRDGWWTGVITRVLDNSRFVVSFENPPDNIEFGISELRVHREWLAGKWVQPQKQRTSALMFSSGKQVEVSVDKEDHPDVWFPALVVEDSGNGSFLVEYQSPGIGDEAGILQVTVDSLHIRPSPPHLQNKNYVLLEKVDAFYDFGWWSGVITKELADSRCVVFFKHANKEREFNHSELRPHMEWKDGKWFSARQDVLIPSDYQGHLGNVCNNANNTEMAVSLSISDTTTKGNSEARTPHSLDSGENRIELSTPYNEKASHFMTSLKKKTEQTTPFTNSRPFKKLKDGNLVEARSLTASKLKTTPMDTPLCGIASLTTGNTGTSSSEQPSVGYQLSAKTDGFSRGKKVLSKQQKVGDLDNNTTDTGRRKGRPEKLQINRPQSSAGGSEWNGMKGSQSKKAHQVPGDESLKPMSDKKRQLDDPAKHRTKQSKRQKVGEMDKHITDTARRKGRPKKLQINRPQSSARAKKDDAAGNTAGESGEESLELRSDQKQQLDDPAKHKTKDDNQFEDGGETSLNQFEDSGETSLKKRRGRPRKSLAKIPKASVADSQDASGGKTASVFEKDYMKKVEIPTDKFPSNMSDDQPLSTWFDGMHSPTVDHSSVSVGSRTLEKCTEATEKQKEIIMQSLAGDVKGDILADENQSLPFLKTTALWKTIESMEVFLMMPQKPHFRPLDCCKESTREGLAIGSMVTFSSVVEKTSKLQCDVPRSTIEDSLETLVELENNGFDVKAVRDRLIGLLFIKDKQVELQDKAKELKGQVIEFNLVKSKIDEEIDDIDKQIRELEEKRALAVSMKYIKDSEIACVESILDGINENIRRSRLEFEGLAAVPW